LPHEAETFSAQDSGPEARTRHIRFGAVAEAILIHSVVFTPGSRVDGGLPACIRHRLNQYIRTTCQYPLHTRRYGRESLYKGKTLSVKED
jgi:hypothetical protein